MSKTQMIILGVLIVAWFSTGGQGGEVPAWVRP
jgi:hypothetical protein